MNKPVFLVIAVFGAMFPFELRAERIPGHYIVELNTPSVAEQLGPRLKSEGPRGPAAVAHRARVRAEQTIAQQALAGRATILDSVDTVANALFVEIPDAQAAQLASLPNVRAVHPMRSFHMVLDRAVAVHNVTGVWNQVGLDRAGAGVKIAIIDSGIDNQHPGFQDGSLTVPDSFPKVNSASDQAYTNNKIIVARSYVSLVNPGDPDRSARDRVGHGTALAMVAAGVQNTGPLATIMGVAPKAYLGNYKVFGTPGITDSTSDAAILKAIDDAVNDGMDVINLSLGSDMAPRLQDDMEVQAVESASHAGVIVVVAAGNNGNDPNTISSPATAPSAIAVGGSHNDRTFSASFQADGLDPFIAVLGDGPTPANSITAPMADMAAVDGNGLGCNALPAQKLSGRIVLILRGSCTFESKLNNAQAAEAIGAVVYATADAPDPFGMAVGAATLPAAMISNADGVALKQRISQGAVTGTLNFSLGIVAMNPNRLVDFSAAGPNVDAGIKPDLVAVGADIYVATETADPNGEMYDPSGYILVDGTSFSTPLVAGAAALLKSARPGLTVNQYRSLLINSASPISASDGSRAGVQQAGTGSLNAFAALQAGMTAYPTALNFGWGDGTATLNRTLTLANAGAAGDTYTITVKPADGVAGPAVPVNTLQLAPGASAQLSIGWTVNAPAGGHEGLIRVSSAATGTQIVVPYWYGVTSSTPAHVTVLDSVASARRGSLQQDAVLFRVTDPAGMPLTGITPQVTALDGGGTVMRIVSHDTDVPGMYGITVRLGAAAGTNTFRIQAGDVHTDIPITGK